ncbi:hypothetical protein [Mechercharimyces sp. CAU 1602]|uniref:hypothetical protein n=1 Tax=Mechercharimyces sp. CAU 1602 TaxID=2973933 RepID=UPI002162C2B5|nr:hypothetical protein [Mechercharimyces sp. CAU 1602]MCS1350892.1 hypothetical protein [Mechercharimyces sp. CAU 1602]
MKKYLNKVMGNYLISLARIEREHSITLYYPKVKQILFPTFIDWDHCVLLKQGDTSDLPKEFRSNRFCPDRTGFEATYNHVHLGDYIDIVTST